MNSSCEASHGVSSELTLSLQDLLAIVVVLRRRRTQHTLLAQTRAQTKVIIKNYYCGSTGRTKGTPTFFLRPCPPIALLRRQRTQEDQILIHRQAQPRTPVTGSRREEHSLPSSPHIFSPPCHSCKSTSITLPNMGEGPVTLQ